MTDVVSCGVHEGGGGGMMDTHLRAKSSSNRSITDDNNNDNNNEEEEEEGDVSRVRGCWYPAERLERSFERGWSGKGRRKGCAGCRL